MLLRCLALIAALVLLAPSASAEEEWWMLRKDDDGKSQCGPPLEADGVVLTPGEILDRFEECKLMDETPSLERIYAGPNIVIYRVLPNLPVPGAG